MPTPVSAVAASHPAKSGASEQRVESPSQYIPILAAGITVAGAIGVAVFIHRMSARREAVARFSAAAKEFRAVFAEELAMLESRAELSVELDMYLFNAYEAKHKVAIATFEHFIPEANRKAFEAACHQYHSGQQVDGEPLDMFEMGATYKQALFVEYQSGISWHHPVSRRALAVNRIRELLAFARHE
jgi:hypothetical protein